MAAGGHFFFCVGESTPFASLVFSWNDREHFRFGGSRRQFCVLVELGLFSISDESKNALMRSNAFSDFTENKTTLDNTRDKLPGKGMRR